MQSRVAEAFRVSVSWRWHAALCAVVVLGGSIVVLAWPRQALGVIYELDERRWLDWPGRVVAGFWLVMGARRLRNRRLERSSGSRSSTVSSNA